jgi:hypothetical protein
MVDLGRGKMGIGGRAENLVGRVRVMKVGVVDLGGLGGLNIWGLWGI